MTENTHRYSKLTFILSVVGFIGSIGFYFGVLRQVYSAPDASVQIEQLQTQNEALENQVKVLTESLKNCQTDE